MRDEQLLRYSRQIMLPEMDVAGQQRLLDSSVLILGAGGLGSPVALYLAAAGVGRLLIADDDRVDLSNLQRQILHSEADIDQPKVASAQRSLQAMNADTVIEPLHERLDPAAMQRLLAGGDIDLVVDASDNFQTRFAINQACVSARVPLVSGAAIRMEGQVSVFDHRRDDSPCYRCLYRNVGDEDTSCASNGVMAPLVGIIGSVQAMEAVKLLAGIGQSLVGRLLLLDATNLQWRELRLPRDPDCPVCGRSQSG